MSNVSLTSTHAHREQIVSGRAQSQRERILECLKDSAVPLTRRQVSELTRIPINAVTGRVNPIVECKVRRDGLTTEIGPYRKRYRALVRVAYEDIDIRTPAEFLEVIALAPVQRSFAWPK